jgi:hypothetical protein
MGSLIKELLRLDAFNLPVVDQLLIWLLTRAADVRVWHFASAPKAQDSRPVLERQPQAGDGFLWRAPRTNAPGACGGPQLVSIAPRGEIQKFIRDQCKHRRYEFFEGGNEPVFGGRQFTQRIDRHATIGGKKLPALPMLQILDVGESSVSQLFR